MRSDEWLREETKPGMDFLFVGLGGALGSVARYALSTFITRAVPVAVFPWGTFGVNLLGCFLIGIATSLLGTVSTNNTELRLLFCTGLIGGFTTFSAFSLEAVALLQGGYAGLAATYVAASVGLGLLFVFFGQRVPVLFG